MDRYEGAQNTVCRYEVVNSRFICPLVCTGSLGLADKSHHYAAALLNILSSSPAAPNL